MLVYNAFSAVRDGTFDQFKNYYSGNVDETDKFEGLNLLCMAMTNDDNPEEKLRLFIFCYKQVLMLTLSPRVNIETHYIIFTIVYGVQILSLLWKLRNY